MNIYAVHSRKKNILIFFFLPNKIHVKEMPELKFSESLHNLFVSATPLQPPPPPPQKKKKKKKKKNNKKEHRAKTLLSALYSRMAFFSQGRSKIIALFFITIIIHIFWVSVLSNPNSMGILIKIFVGLVVKGQLQLSLYQTHCCARNEKSESNLIVLSLI